MEYKINSIKHSGRKGERGIDRTDGRYPMRIGRTVDSNSLEIIKGYPCYLHYLKDSDGSDYSGMVLRTSGVVDAEISDDVIIIETNNSIYELIRVVDSEEYNDNPLEDDNLKFIWGVKSWDDLTNCDANLYTMNDIDICYDKKANVYMLGVETAYYFKDYESECNYLKRCLEAFTKYMDDNNLNKNERCLLFMSNPCTKMTAKTIEKLYTNFKIFVNGYCSLQ